MMSPGCTTFRLTRTPNINIASNTYKYTSLVIRGPSLPPVNSTTRNTDRIRIKIPVKYKVRMYFCQLMADDAGVGVLRSRRSKIKLVTRKTPKKMICKKRPTTMRCFPLLMLLALDTIEPPTDVSVAGWTTRGTYLLIAPRMRVHRHIQISWSTISLGLEPCSRLASPESIGPEPYICSQRKGPEPPRGG